MTKRIGIGIAAVGLAIALLPLFAAFEAHVVNVTAKIENALQVSTDWIDFGTVFPQEHLDQPLRVALSQSFLDEDRVDDVEYFLRQKPKCAITRENGTVLVDEPLAATGHLVLDQEGEVTVDCGPAPRALVEGESWGMLPSLCEYISKEGPDENDETLTSFHQPWTIVGDGAETPFGIAWNDTHGRLAKSDTDLEDEIDGDTVDNWIIDLAVPCFGGFCAQDWADFVAAVSGSSTINADEYTQPKENEHKIFGCDLWVEVSEVSCALGEETLTQIGSDTNTTVAENGDAPAELVTSIHPAWTASIPFASWIWESDPVDNPTLTETFTFERTFTVSGTVTSAFLNIATDNTYRAFVNDILVGQELVNPNNFQAATQDAYAVTNLAPGLNTLKIEVTNEGMPGGTPETNPAGLLYKLSYNSKECVEPVE
ncbi:hypothetical protein C4552_04145 [Candidatus Parcubacteria bacterium]|nr:MAG: hypothetical protein C4552_04145 [Candidatus Parcubacteria bacterium]